MFYSGLRSFTGYRGSEYAGIQVCQVDRKRSDCSKAPRNPQKGDLCACVFQLPELLGSAGTQGRPVAGFRRRMFFIWYKHTQARRKVLENGAANSEKGRGRGSERGLILISSLALIRSPGKKYITDIGRYILWLFWDVNTKHFSADYYGILHAFLSLQINQIINVIMMIPIKTHAPKTIHKHNLWGWDPWPLHPGDHLHHEDSRMKVARRQLLLWSNHNGTMWWRSSHAKTNTFENSTSCEILSTTRRSYCQIFGGGIIVQLTWNQIHIIP